MGGQESRGEGGVDIRRRAGDVVCGWPINSWSLYVALSGYKPSALRPRSNTKKNN